MLCRNPCIPADPSLAELRSIGCIVVHRTYPEGMPRNRGGETVHTHGLTHAAEWLDGKLVPALGPPPLGPYGAEPPHSTTCPLCGEALARHVTEKAEGHVFLHCPNGTVTETGRAA